MARASAEAVDITRLLHDASAGDQTAEERLLDVLYDDLHRIARRHMRGERTGHTLQPTALVNEAFVRLMRGAETAWQDRLHFLATASTVMRRVLVDYARRRTAAKREHIEAGPDRADDFALDFAHDPERVLVVDQALETLARESERQAKIVELRFFAGLGNDEIAEILQVSSRTVKRDWLAAKAWLYRYLDQKA
jgi:RNA polymerase sigma-70 factor, ECF subfamily